MDHRMTPEHSRRASSVLQKERCHKSSATVWHRWNSWSKWWKTIWWSYQWQAPLPLLPLLAFPYVSPGSSIPAPWKWGQIPWNLLPKLNCSSTSERERTRATCVLMWECLRVRPENKVTLGGKAAQLLFQACILTPRGSRFRDENQLPVWTQRNSIPGLNQHSLGAETIIHQKITSRSDFVFVSQHQQFPKPIKS